MKYVTKGSEEFMRPRYLYQNLPEGGQRPVAPDLKKDVIRESERKLEDYFKDVIVLKKPGEVTGNDTVKSLRSLGYIQ